MDAGIFPGFRIQDQIPEEEKSGLEMMATADRMHYILDWLTRKSRVKSNIMLYMIMYDIEDNKVRTQLAKYLIKQGCLRIQKSVYLAKSSVSLMNEITDVIKDINEMYTNHDSIFILPIPEDKFNHMRVIGQSVEFEIVTKPKNVLIF